MHINKVLILSERSFVSPSFSPESKTFSSSSRRGNVSKHTEELATRERKRELHTTEVQRESSELQNCNNQQRFNVLHVSPKESIIIFL